MKPYYEADGITIYHGDCRGVLPSVTAETLLTDPPYGIGFQSNMRTASPRFAKIHGDDTPWRAWLGVVSTDVVALFTRWDVLGCWVDALAVHTTVRGCAVWDKPGGGLGDLGRSYAPDYEMILYGSKDCWQVPGKRHGSVWRCHKDAAAAYQHPTQKPVGIMEMCVDRFSELGATVLDPFMGSGTTLVAAKNLNRKAIGIEIEERYCEIAARRLSQQVLDFGGAA